MWAWLFRYFWLPCHLCGTYYGGHEWRDIDGKSSTVSVVGYRQIFAGADIFRESTTSKGICPACTREGLGDRSAVEIIPSPFGALPR